MTDERIKFDSGADDDTGVTQAYRDTKDERAPDALNRAILEQAAKAARPRYSRIRLWTRPMAWAATVMLSVAIVLQLTQTPTPDEIGFDRDALEPAEQLEETVGTVQKTEALRSTAKQVAPAASPEVRQREQQAKATMVEPAERSLADQQPAARAPSSAIQAISEVDNSAFEFKDQDIANMRESETREAIVAEELPQPIAADMAYAGAASESNVPDRCDETATATPETWLQCITALEEAGLADAAGEERERLTAAFPDFDTP
jgi:hypothetical protein